jgi:hypothetical protein
MNTITQPITQKIVYSPGYGAGFSTWSTKRKELATDSEIIRLVEMMKEVSKGTEQWHTIVAQICRRAREIDPAVYLGAVKDGELEVTRIPISSRFRISENDGFEVVEYEEEPVFWW